MKYENTIRKCRLESMPKTVFISMIEKLKTKKKKNIRNFYIKSLLYVTKRNTRELILMLEGVIHIITQ